MTVSFVLKIEFIARLSQISLLLKQLMTILFDNAIKYTEEDGEIDFVVQLLIVISILQYPTMESVFQQMIRRKSLTVFIEWIRLEPVKKVVLV